MRSLSDLLDVPGLDDVDAEVASGLAVAAPASLRARLVGAARGRGRLAAHVAALAELLDVPAEKAAAWLDGLDEASAFETGPLPGVGMVHLVPGERVRGADAGFVRFPAGIAWPLHRHRGEERMLLLEGTIHEDGGGTLRPGDLLVRGPGSEHSFHVDPASDAIVAVVLHVGLEMPPGVPVTLG